MTPPPPPPLDARGLPVGYAFKPDWEITPRQTRDALASAPSPAKAPLIIDCRRDDEWSRGHLAQAQHIPLDQIERRRDDIEDLAGDPARTILVYCHHGMRSLRATAALRAMGFPNTRSVAGGIDLWSIDIDPAIPRY